jgi:hypothetical protein
MEFKDKFKPGDIICSDRFHDGLCMIVEKGYVGLHPEKFKYRCTDLVKEYQLWAAYEFDVLDRPNNWRIATDNDIVNYIARFVDIKIGAVGTYDLKYLEYGIMLIESIGDYYGDAIILNAEELIQLKKIIEQRVGVCLEN